MALPSPFTADEWLSLAMGTVGALAAGVLEGKAVSALCTRLSDARPGRQLLFKPLAVRHMSNNPVVMPGPGRTAP